MVFSLQPALSVPVKSEIVRSPISQTPNIMMELVDNWGFELTECSQDVVIIKHDITEETACIIPNEEIQAGNFIYDSTQNKIYPETTETTETPETTETIEKTETPETTETIKTIETTETNTSDDIATKPQTIGETGIIFDFVNAYDYNVCLDNILLAYENRQTELEQSIKNECANNILATYGDRISQAVALELITSADRYATQDLEVRLYPTYGLRRRIAMHFGYIYDIDNDNEDILRYTNSEG